MPNQEIEIWIEVSVHQQSFFLVLFTTVDFCLEVLNSK